MKDEIKNVFISHVHEDDEGLSKLKFLLERHGLTIRDSSINSSNPNNANNPGYIKSSILAPQIKWAGTLIVYISHRTRDSEWVNWEIEYASKLGKRIVGVWEQGAKDCVLPEALTEYADAVVGWHGNSIIDAIIGGKDGWETPDGDPSDRLNIKPHRC